ncbi:MAG: hypothetical protein PSV35_06970 [bacterium]|nr:hypothetical protein [bacterium]
MKSFQSIEDKHFKTLSQEGNDSVLNSLELSETTAPLLKAYLLYLRKIKGVHNKTDVKNETSQLMSEFKFLCEHNLLFFLTVTGRFDIIRQLFTPYAAAGKILHLIHSIERERIIEIANQSSSLLMHKKLQPEIASSLSEEDWEQSVSSLTSMDLYQYFDGEIKRISHSHHHKQIDVLERAYDAKIARIQHVLDVIADDANISDEIKNEGVLLQNELLAKRAERDAALNDLRQAHHQEPGIINTLELHRQVTEQHYNEVAEKVKVYFETISALRPDLDSVIREDQEENRIVTEELAINEGLFKQQLDGLIVHHDNARMSSKEAVEKNLDAIIKTIDSTSKSNLDMGQKQEIVAVMGQLKMYQKELHSSSNYDQTQNLLMKCKAQLTKAEELLKPVLSQQVQKKMNEELAAFQQMIIVSEQPGSPFVPSAPDNILAEMPEVIPGIANDAPKSSLKFSSFEGSSTVSPSASVQSDLSQEDHPQASPPMQDMKKFSNQFRDFMIAAREHGNASEQTISILPEHQEDYESALKKISNCLKEIKDEAEDPALIERIDEIQSLIRKVNAVGFEQAYPSKIKEILNSTHDLELNNNTLSRSMHNLVSIFNLEEESPQERMQI